jgi:Ring finger domain
MRPIIGADCPVCLDPLPPIAESAFWSTHCRHRMHRTCLKAWSKVHTSCPVAECRHVAVHAADTSMSDPSALVLWVYGMLLAMICANLIALQCDSSARGVKSPSEYIWSEAKQCFFDVLLRAAASQSDIPDSFCVIECLPPDGDPDTVCTLYDGPPVVLSHAITECRDMLPPTCDVLCGLSRADATAIYAISSNHHAAAMPRSATAPPHASPPASHVPDKKAATV